VIEVGILAQCTGTITDEKERDLKGVTAIKAALPFTLLFLR
jgi:hypothetical protein